jgi:hypothetical protein
MLTIPFIGIIFWVFIIALTPPNSLTNNRYTSLFTTSLLLFYVLLVVSLKEHFSIDMERYIRDYELLHNYNLIDAMKNFDREPFFLMFQWALSQLTTNTEAFYIAVGFSISIILIIALRKYFEPWQVVLIFFSYLNFFLFFPYITNTIRQGFAIAFILLALMILLSKGRQFGFYFSIIIAPLFHFSSIPMSLILLVLSKFYIPLKYTLLIWFSAALLFVTGLNYSLFSPLESLIPQIDVYTDASTILNYGGGTNRIEFFIFSFLGLALSFLLRNRLNNNNTYNLLLNAYILFNSYFLLLGFIAFSDRLASYSWFLLPILFWYPILTIQKNRRLLIFFGLLAFILVSLITESLLYF